MKRVLICLSILILLPCVAFGSAYAYWLVHGQYVQHSVAPVAQVSASDIDLNQLLTLTNQDRGNAKISPLSLDQNLVKSAQDKCADMVAHSYYDHISPSGVTWQSFIQKYTPNYALASENLDARWQPTNATQVEQLWMASPEHRANILDTSFTKIGLTDCIGTFQNKPTLFIVAHFLEPEKPVTTVSYIPPPIVPAVTPYTAYQPTPNLASATPTCDYAANEQTIVDAYNVKTSAEARRDTAVTAQINANEYNYTNSADYMIAIGDEQNLHNATLDAISAWFSAQKVTC
jgi:hypothetical protein